MTDLVTQLATLRAIRASATDAIQSAALDAAIAALEAQQPRTHTQQISGYATIAAAISGDVHGDLYIVGERAQSTSQLLIGYLRWLADSCGQIPLRGVHEQKSTSDVLNIGLDQVYMQLATNELVEREVFTGDALQRFDARSYLAQHQGSHLLPIHQRHALRLGGRGSADTSAAGTRSEVTEERLAGLSAEQLARLAGDTDRLRFLGPQLVTEALATHRRLVLLGEPGSGKSTALRYVALTLARAGLDQTRDLAGLLPGWQALDSHGRCFPLFMPLLPLAKRLAEQPGRHGNAADLWAAIDTHMHNHGATADVVTALRTELARGTVLLLLDGLDEVAGGHSRQQVIDAVRAFAEEQPQCRIVVACRVRAYTGPQNAAWQLVGWPTAVIVDWTPGQVRAFISAWYGAAAAASRMPESKRDARVAALQRAVVDRSDLRRLSIRPLLLTIMAVVHLNDGTLPEARVSLYARCLDILLGQWEIAGKDETIYGTLMQYIGLPDAEVKSLRPLLSRVAFMAHAAAQPDDVGRLRRADLRELVAEALEQLKHPNPHDGAKRFLEYTDVRAGLLHATEAGDAYAFPHQTFQEYLAGLELISGVGFVERIMERRDDDRWRGPVFLGMGHAVSEGILSAPYQLLNRLLHERGRDEPQRQHDLIFAAEIAADVTWERLERGGPEFTALRADLARALSGVVEGSALTCSERVRAGVLLGQLGDPRLGVCDLPPSLVGIAGGRFVIGSTLDEREQALASFERTYFGDDKEDLRQAYRDYLSGEQNDQAMLLAPFEIARYPVTNAQYACFIHDDGYNAAKPWWDAAGRAWLLRDDNATEGLAVGQRRHFKHQPEWWEDARSGQLRPNHPVVGVSWYEAMAFCRWLTQHAWYNSDGCLYLLPSELEWEYAARGCPRRVYPWGSEVPDSERANFDLIYRGTTAVGCFVLGATPQGVLDMAGNVLEWTRSVYQPYPYDPNDGRETPGDPAQKRFTLRGGGWNSQPFSLRAPLRSHDPPDSRYGVVGFRLVRHLLVE